MKAGQSHPPRLSAGNNVEKTIRSIKENIQNNKRGRRRSYATALMTVFVLAGVAAALAAIWPIRDQTIQPDFFVSLGTTILTVFGLVFTLCIIGVQIASSLGHINVRHVFNGWTWLYLSSFLVSALWSLAIGYSSKETPPTQKICFVSFLGKTCISQSLAGRVAIYGVTVCFLLLLPFMRVIFTRISTESIFGRYSRALVRARSPSRLHRHIRQFLNDLELIKESSDSCERALEIFLVGAAQRITKQPVFSRLTVTEVAHSVTHAFGDINILLRDTASSTVALMPQSRWIAWLFVHNPNRWNALSARKIDRREINSSARFLLDVCEGNLRLWRTGQLTARIVIPSVQSGLSISSVTASCHGRLNLVRFSDELATCINHVSSETGTPISNLLSRALANIVCDAQRIGGSGVESTWTAFDSALKTLYPKGGTGSSPPYWILFEFHKLLDFSCDHGGIPDSVIDFLLTIPAVDFGNLIRGAFANKKHRDCRRHAEWQLTFGRRAWSLGAFEQFGIAYKIATWSAATDGNIDVALECLSTLISAYVDGKHYLTEPIADAFMAVVRYMNKHPEIFQASENNTRETIPAEPEHATPSSAASGPR